MHPHYFLEIYEDHLIDWDSEEPPYEAFHKIGEIEITGKTGDQVGQIIEEQEKQGNECKFKRRES